MNARSVISLLSLGWTLCLSIPTPALAGAERVAVLKVLEDDDDSLIIQRRNGESYLIEKGVGCLSAWRYEGRTAIVDSPGLFAGVGSSLILPEVGQKCRIWGAERID